MNNKDLLKRIEVNPEIMVGKPIIKGTRLTVQYILNLLAQGTTIEDILQEYEGLTREDIQACLFFANEALESSTFVPLSVEDI